ncbi:transcriptional regulator family: Fungal Specific TF [Trichoderma aggressivum f. europaeum]|uniref:Transcriptional regulator family: Fungal Specific TF n=1 Tax=Trichoderma aggressivum f. europaeum TaxID=173218 RepID=A0AAE1J5B0_9HYPO|nr:transcriptional regulator family: Fungal Specific TF [Trichoderma aggressivum f. europaeum]
MYLHPLQVRDTAATLSHKDGSRQRIQDSVDTIYRVSGVEKRKVGSCDECRRTKSRCSRTRPTCKRCVRKGFACKYNAKYDAAASQSPSSSMPVEDQMLTTSNRSGSVSTPGSQANLMAGSLSAQISPTVRWLFADDLPQDRFHLQSLADKFFDRISTLRCLGFIHKPTFYQALDRGTLSEDFGEAVIYIVAALGARMYLLDIPTEFNNPFRGIPGAAWAERARDLAMREIANPSLSTMMAMVLICEHSISMDQHALAFVVFGCCVRIMRLLSLDSPKKVPASPGLAQMTQLEAERRLLWSCYILDSFLGGGVDGNLYWKDDFPCVPLPCSDANFVAQEQYLDFNAPKLSTFELFPDRSYLNLRSHTIYLVQLRTRVLRLIRNNSQEGNIWDPGSALLDIIQRLEIWYAGLPEQLVISDLNAYVHKELSIISAVFMLHFLYHSIVCDLLRVSLPGYVFPLSVAFHSAPLEFRRQCQERCRFHADEVSRLVRVGFGYGIRVFDDLHSLMATFESTKIQIIHTATATSNAIDVRERTSYNIQLNMRALDVLHVQKDKPNPYHKALLPLLEKFDFNNVVAEWQAYPSPVFVTPPQTLTGLSNHSLFLLFRSMDSEQAEVTGPEDTGFLSSLAPFRLAKEEIRAQTKQRRGSSPTANDPVSPTTVRPPPIISMPQKGALGGVGGGIGNGGVLENTDFSLDRIQLASATPAGVNDQDVAAQIQGGVPKEVVDFSDLSEDYIRMAGEMANYISWDISEPPSWLDFDISSSNI